LGFTTATFLGIMPQMELTPPTILTGAWSRSWYGSSIGEFLQTDPDAIIGQLVRNGEFDLLATQKGAWFVQIGFLQSQLTGLTGSIFLEFNIPRIARRIDTVLLIGPVIFVIEFKVGESIFKREALDQAWDYALDLKNFHEASHPASIVPILIATEAMESGASSLQPDEDKVYRPVSVAPSDFRETIDVALRSVTGEPLDGREWPSSPYHPTPTIIEAARALYAQHSVEAIARYDAGAQNLRVTSVRIEQLVDEARQKKCKLICFVTGVPGAGKTLVGLNVATRRRDTDQPTHAVFLSGNAPLVAVLREALVRDEVARQRGLDNRVRKGKVAESVKAFIQNVHNFRDEALHHSGPPVEHVVIFDEAQRAWNLQQTASFMKRRKNLPGFSDSEPEFLISCMDRHTEWAVIVCLVGGGQEIHTGEAGIEAWLEAVNSRFPDWQMYISSRLTDSEYAAGRALDVIRHRQNTHFDDCLHLAVSRRSFRAENVSAFVKALLDCEKQQARETFARLHRYPITVTRDLSRAKQWVRSRARGTERFGLIASSKAQRLKPHAIDIRVDVDPVHWFLNDKDDTRSSYYLEDAATEFQVQGLELDWACVTWDGDLRFEDFGWSFHDFRGARWTNVANADIKRYVLNAYRVLLTRARQGMVIFIPPGESSDPTRSPEFYDSTFRYLSELGIPELQ
jgi:Schlafen group 3, DNA/RNA helicase domain